MRLSLESSLGAATLRHLLTILALLTISGCASSTVPGAGARSEDDVLSLRLEADRPVTRNLQQTRLKLTVKNTGDEAIILDNELLAGFNLKVETDPSDGSLFSQDRDVSAERIRTLDKPSPGEAAKRFVKVAPGESLSRRYDLSRPIRYVAQGHATYKGGGHVGFYYEAEDSLRVPTAAKKLIIRIVYDGKVWMMSHRQFEEWFGVSEEESGMWQGRAESNTVTVGKQ